MKRIKSILIASLLIFSLNSCTLLTVASVGALGGMAGAYAVK